MTDAMQYEQFEHGEFEPISEDSTEIITINEFGQEVRSVSKIQRICDFCQATQTPMWRRGPGGKGTLCNACGVKWSLRRRPVVVTTKKYNAPSAVGNLALIEQIALLATISFPVSEDASPSIFKRKRARTSITVNTATLPGQCTFSRTDNSSELTAATAVGREILEVSYFYF